jgi:hypothetical protein
LRKERPALIGSKEREFGPLPSVTLEELVPADFSSPPGAHADLGLVGDVVRDTYADGGRPSIDPAGWTTCPVPGKVHDALLS